MTDLHIVLGNQLFPIEHIKKIKPKLVYMREDLGLCTYQKHHKHKIILFLSTIEPLLVFIICSFISIPLIKLEYFFASVY